LFVTSSRRGSKPRRGSGNCSSYPKWHARDPATFGLHSGPWASTISSLPLSGGS